MRSRRTMRCLLALSALALACGGDEAPKPSGAPMARGEAAPVAERTENAPPEIERVLLNPQRPLPGHTLEARIEASDPDGDPIRFSVEWRQAGRVISSGSQTRVTPESLRKGDEIEAIVTATDGRDESAPVRATAMVGNQPPLIPTLDLAPAGDVRPGQEVTAELRGEDPDGDALAYEYEWLLNGKVVRGADQARFDTKQLARGDRIQVRVRVTDGEASSAVAESRTLELANRPPKIASVPRIESVEGGIQAQLEAEDPDGDKSLRFRLLEGPRGLTLDAVTGRLAWQPEPGTLGTHAVEVGVADSFGAESALRFELTVSTPSDEQAAPPAKPRARADADEESEE